MTGFARTIPSLLCALLTVGACSKESARPACSAQNMCSNGDVCMMGTCLPLGGNRKVGIAIVPKADSSSANTVLANKELTSDPLELVADRRADVLGRVSNAPNAHVEMTLTSPIQGQSDLKVQGELLNAEFRVTLAQSLLNQKSFIWVVPNDNPKMQPQSPPVRFQSIVYNTITLTFPPPAEMIPLRVKLVDTFKAPQVGYLARASTLMRPVSNLAQSEPSGEFNLLIAPSSLDPEATVTVEFTPIAADGEQVLSPRFVTRPFVPGAPNSGTSNGSTAKVDAAPAYELPAFPTPVPLRFRVQGIKPPLQSDSVPQPEDLPDVSLRFRTEFLENAATQGTGIFDPEVKTSAVGEAEAKLIPGTASDPRRYEVTIVPHPDSPYAARCIQRLDVTMGATGDGQTPYAATWILEPKVWLTGTILGHDGKPASDVTVKATFATGNTRCANVTSTNSVSSPTGRDGTYRLLVDPGMYRLDVDPPPGAPWPRWTEDGDRMAVVGTSGAVHDVTLPAGEVVVGHVRGADERDLDGASVSMFEVMCNGDTCGGPSRVQPALRAVTSTDLNGRFTAVLPVLP